MYMKITKQRLDKIRKMKYQSAKKKRKKRKPKKKIRTLRNRHVNLKKGTIKRKMKGGNQAQINELNKKIMQHKQKIAQHKQKISFHLQRIKNTEEELKKRQNKLAVETYKLFIKFKVRTPRDLIKDGHLDNRKKKYVSNKNTKY